jgi:hypothetical protein
MLPFIHGAIAMGCGVATLFFLRFWKSTGDRLFVYFAAAFAVLSAHWIALGVLDLPTEIRFSLYVPRLIAFVLIILGIVDKNRRAG